MSIMETTIHETTKIRFKTDVIGADAGLESAFQVTRIYIFQKGNETPVLEISCLTGKKRIIPQLGHGFNASDGDSNPTPDDVPF